MIKKFLNKKTRRKLFRKIYGEHTFFSTKDLATVLASNMNKRSFWRSYEVKYSFLTSFWYVRGKWIRGIKKYRK